MTNFEQEFQVWTMHSDDGADWTLRLKTNDGDEAVASFAALSEGGFFVAIYERGLYKHKRMIRTGLVAFVWSDNLNGYMRGSPQGRGVGWSDDDTYVNYASGFAGSKAQLIDQVQQEGPKDSNLYKNYSTFGSVLPSMAISYSNKFSSDPITTGDRPNLLPPNHSTMAPDIHAIKIVDWNYVGWSFFEAAVCFSVGIATIGSKDLFWLFILFPIGIIGVVTFLQKLFGIVVDVNDGFILFYSFWLKNRVAISEIKDANCEFGVPVSPAKLLLGLFSQGSKSGRSQAQQRTYMVNLSGKFGSRQIRFSHKRWRDQFLSVLKDAAPGCRITRWR